MNLEIERKFLVKNELFIQQSFQKNYLKQGFLNSNPERVVRVRVSDEKAFLTIKGKTSKTGTTRFEWEKEISIEEGQELLKLCEEGIIEKTRYLIKAEKHTFEVDVFLGNNKGLIVAEVELTNESETFLKPDWLGEEVTGNINYFNSNLIKKPFCNW